MSSEAEDSHKLGEGLVTRTCSAAADVGHGVASEGLQYRVALQVRGHNHCVLAQVEGEGVT